MSEVREVKGEIENEVRGKVELDVSIRAAIKLGFGLGLGIFLWGVVLFFIASALMAAVLYPAWHAMFP